MKTLPPDAVPYKRTTEFTEATAPAGLQQGHQTRASVWGRITIVSGSLLYRILEEPTGEYILDTSTSGVIEPEVKHEIELRGPVRFYIEFLRSP